MRGAPAVVTWFVTLFVLTHANQHGCGNCQRFRHQYLHSPSRWQVWNNPTVRHLMSLPNAPLGYANEQASRLWDYMNQHTTDRGQYHDTGGHEDVDGLNTGVEHPPSHGCNQQGDDTDYPHGPTGIDYPDCQYHHVTREEPTTEITGEESQNPHDESTRITANLRHVQDVWKQWMETMTDSQWDANWPYFNQIVSTLWKSGDDKELGEDEHTATNQESTEEDMEDDQFYSGLIRKEMELKRELAANREQIRQLQENIKSERKLQKQREEEKRLQVEREERRREKGRLWKKLEKEQQEMEREMQQEQEHLRQLQEEQQMLREQRLAADKAANHQTQHKGNKADYHNQHQSPQHDDTHHRQFRNQHTANKQQQHHQKQQQQRQNQQQQQQQQQRSELFSLQIPGEYTPRDIKVKTSGADVRVVGKRVCGCDENCVVKEFVRGFKLPPGVPTASLQATFYADGHLSIGGATNQREPRVVDTEVPVVPRGVFEDVSSIRDRLDCLKKKSGFKMSKMDKKTGKAYEAEDLKQTDYVRSSMSDYEDDGVTIEDVDE